MGPCLDAAACSSPALLTGRGVGEQRLLSQAASGLGAAVASEGGLAAEEGTPGNRREALGSRREPRGELQGAPQGAPRRRGSGVGLGGPRRLPTPTLAPGRQEVCALGKLPLRCSRSVFPGPPFSRARWSFSSLRVPLRGNCKNWELTLVSLLLLA